MDSKTATSVNTDSKLEGNTQLPPRKRTPVDLQPVELPPKSAYETCVEVPPSRVKEKDVHLEFMCVIETSDGEISKYPAQGLTIPGGAHTDRAMSTLLQISQHLNFLCNQVVLDMKRWKENLDPKNPDRHPTALNDLDSFDLETERRLLAEAGPEIKPSSSSEIKLKQDL